MSTARRPIVSVLVINWNGRHLLDGCLRSILRSDYEPLEVIVLDCASTDGSADFVRNRFPAAKLVTFKTDPLPDYAYNLGVQHAEGDYVVLMNNDTTLRSDTIRILVQELEEDLNSVVAAVELDATGAEATHRGAYVLAIPVYLALRRSIRFPSMNLLRPFAISIACAIATKRAFLDVPANPHIGFYEELEWFWRFRLQGIRPRIARSARFYHKGAATARYSTKVAYYAGRNSLAAHFIALGPVTLACFLPYLSIYCLAKIVGYAVRGRFKHLKAFSCGLLDFLRNIRAFWHDRMVAQKRRRVGDSEILRDMIYSCEYGYRASGLSLRNYLRKLARDA
jgi:GT2 family glycosyltransferase